MPLASKRFPSASLTTVGVELTHPIRKGQFKFGNLWASSKTASEVWNAVLAA
jgi:hypothetical protein